MTRVRPLSSWTWVSITKVEEVDRVSAEKIVLKCLDMAVKEIRIVILSEQELVHKQWILVQRL